MEGEPNAPWIHSVSYGDKESSISTSYANRCNTEFQKFGTTGRTIFFASGDDGVGCGSSSCTPNGNPLLEPNWPATSPYVTAVVCTTLHLGSIMILILLSGRNRIIKRWRLTRRQNFFWWIFQLLCTSFLAIRCGQCILGQCNEHSYTRYFQFLWSCSSWYVKFLICPVFLMVG